jgi:Glutathione S-transferase, C-terminal domain
VTFGATVFRFVSNTAERFPAELKNPKQAEVAKKELETLLGILNAELAGKDYLGGAAFGLLDVSVGSMITFARMMAGLDMAPYPNVDAWSQRWWFVVVLGVLGVVVVVVAFLSDVKEADRTAILVPMVPLAVGAALVFTGLRIKR